jgi:hypothetical protein
MSKVHDCLLLASPSLEHLFAAHCSYCPLEYTVNCCISGSSKVESGRAAGRSKDQPGDLPVIDSHRVPYGWVVTLDNLAGQPQQISSCPPGLTRPCECNLLPSSAKAHLAQCSPPSRAVKCPHKNSQGAAQGGRHGPLANFPSGSPVLSRYLRISLLLDFSLIN